MRIRDLIFVSVVVSGGLAMSRGLIGRSTSLNGQARSQVRANDGLASSLHMANSTLAAGHSGGRSVPPPLADELAVMRRLALGLLGSIPSLEEIRRFELMPKDRRLEAWLDRLLEDRRSADYLAERFARAFVGTEDGPFLLFRRRRFTAWLSDAIHDNRSLDKVVRDLIAEEGLWTDRPATNFLSVTFSEETKRPDPERLAARVARAFLGVRLDCAQCHDHPFQHWKQADFRGLAAFFSPARSSLLGITDDGQKYLPTDRKTKQTIEVEPRVPYLPGLRPSAGRLREQLAAWIVHPENPNLARATVNRTWAILFGRPLVEPVDDIPSAGETPLLDMLATDFVAHRFDLHRLIRIVTATDAFRAESIESTKGQDPTSPPSEFQGSFPLTRLRPEQVAGAICQVSSIWTLGPESPWLVRLAAYTSRNEFVRRYGDSGEDEFAAGAGTIPQRLLMMNGELVRDRTKGDLLAATTLIAQLAPEDHQAVEQAFLVVLTRRPTPEESDHFVHRLRDSREKDRQGILTDLCWTLLNSAEFSWNH